MLDETDIRILAALQQDARLTSQDMGERLNLSSSQVGRRRQRLEAEGYITGYSARLSPMRLGLAVQAFIQVHMQSHARDQAESFVRLVSLRPEIISAWTLTGEADYLLRVYCADLSALNQLVQNVLLRHGAVARVHSQIVMDQMKADAPFPV